ncbi:preprotein translocase subunit YajC [Chryseobacterium arthrosphaerae]|uniref:Sec translocon accessory complex subunit YajC n=1 Tax=Chryseobacterium arthrosphaerae TaxID=651561 RepID=A0A1B8ZV78_9FLAO|nr:preprotein translocase subunit YajC [Chryseobacterium arthrosphaerae]AYZ13938.1 preprotein translocase subunit YajC [Chryseobacterium arthrosphaerae]MDG4654086.1 preprotein translocase subunit YajC [Chryseobacterium arthrosphaerae]OCA75495.1 preprotein translocase subunit YajC [Chryseobacterium arthrosphaerae]RTZ50030.1 preprotein translocase subunit YajC [Chryseobacterium arthrosphaerae]UEQ74649.1 preprotein translocase subunit YajC [Chryseobacterium arthrosphaerae]
MLTVFLQAQPGGSSSMMLIMMGVMFVGFYFLMIRPQMKKQKQEKNFQENLKVGTRVVLTSGLHGRIAQVQDDGFVIETLSGKLKFEKAAVSREMTEARFGDKAKATEKTETEEKK